MKAEKATSAYGDSPLNSASTDGSLVDCRGFYPAVTLLSGSGFVVWLPDENNYAEKA